MVIEMCVQKVDMPSVEIKKLVYVNASLECNEEADHEMENGNCYWCSNSEAVIVLSLLRIVSNGWKEAA